jgi:ribonuclease VapC
MRYVLDASALLAGLNNEKGAVLVAAALDSGLVSAVNIAEVAAGLIKNGNHPDQARSAIEALGCTIIPADEEMAIAAGFMRAVTDRAGLSLGDRFCLALARKLRAPALTTDRQWALVAEELGVQVELIR